MKTPKTQKVKAWAAIVDYELCPVGNGEQWQYPLFTTRNEAVVFNRIIHGTNKICRALIIYPVPQK